jgi:probable rRNA maturation factor
VIEITTRAPAGVDAGRIERRLRGACERLGVDRASLGLMIVGPAEMAAINLRHRGTDAATDVLAFPIDGEELKVADPAGPPPELGDVVICPEAAQDPLEVLAVHGLLHLLGYDHETDEGEMLALQAELAGDAV